MVHPISRQVLCPHFDYIRRKSFSSYSRGLVVYVCVALESQPAPAPAPAPPQTVTDMQPGGMVYVPGFDWLETQGTGEVIYDESIHENGNKIGIMG